MINYLLRLHSKHVSHGMPPRIRLRTSYHEAGHGFFMAQNNLWKEVRIKLTGTGGLAFANYADKDVATNIYSIWKILQMLLAGLVVEQYFFNSYSKFGTMQDLENALCLIEKHKRDLAEFVEEQRIEHSPALIKDVKLASTDDLSAHILSAAICSCLDEVATNRQKIRCLGKALYHQARLSDSEVRRLLKNV